MNFDGDRTSYVLRNNIFTTCKAVTLCGGQWIIFYKVNSSEVKSEPAKRIIFNNRKKKSHASLQYSGACHVQFSFAVLPAIFVSFISFQFFSSPFFLGNHSFISKRRGIFFPFIFYCHLAIFRLQILSSAGLFPPISHAFHSFRTPITRPFLSHLPNPSQCSHSLFSRALVPGPRPLNCSFILAPLVP